MLSPEHEVEALQNVMADFSGAVDRGEPNSQVVKCKLMSCTAKKGEGPRLKKEIGPA